MKIFNFFKKAKTRDQILNNASPALQRVAFILELEYVIKEAANLKTVGRHAEADSHENAYIKKCFDMHLADPYNPEPINHFVKSCMALGKLDMCVRMLVYIVENVKALKLLDLTTVYFNLGKLYHKIYGTSEEEFSAFRMGAEAIAPPKCPFPATVSDKARCHLFAMSCAACLEKEDDEKFHYDRLLAIDSNVNWSDTAEAFSWLNSK
jgi:hypothetical protein